MLVSVCLFCGKSGCRCQGGPGNKDWRAPIASLRDAAGMHVPDSAVVVLGAAPEDFDMIWGQDSDWDLSLETF